MAAEHKVVTGGVLLLHCCNSLTHGLYSPNFFVLLALRGRLEDLWSSSPGYQHLINTFIWRDEYNTGY